MIDVRETQMDVVVPGLYALAPARLPFDGSLAMRSFLLERDDGNLLVYRGDSLVVHAEEVWELGGLTRQYLNHRHEASPACNWIAQTFGAPLFVHRAEARAVAETADTGAVFFQRHLLDDDFEVIPTPGHTDGATAYLWDTGWQRILFTGDTIYLRDGEWVAAVLGSSDRERYLESLELIRGLEFDIVVPWVATVGQPYHAVACRAEAERRIDAILARLRRGENS